MLWEPLLSGGEAVVARELVTEIAVAVEALPRTIASGLKGEASNALVLAYCGRPSAEDRLDTALRVELGAPSTISLFGGICGILWVLQHLSTGHETAELVSRCDRALLRYLHVQHWKDGFDLMNGLAGVGVYVARRTDDLALEIADRVLDHLEATSLRDDAGITWPTACGEDGTCLSTDRLVVDAGVAHGVVGVIGMLGQFVEMRVQESRSRGLLREALRWLLSRVPEPRDQSSRFRTSWPQAPHDVSRLGWCYGDAGVAGVLLSVARVESATELRAIALRLLENVALSSPVAVDGCFCHGTAGLAHIYNVAYQATGSEIMRIEARRWIAETFRIRRPASGVAGYQTLRRGVPVADPRLVTGAAGIALVLLAAVGEHEPAWQTLFLL